MKFQFLASWDLALKNAARKASRFLVLEVLLETFCLESIFTLFALESQILKRIESETGQVG